MLGSGRNPAVLRRGDGADDDSSRRAIEGDGEEDHLVGGGGNYWGDGSNDATVAGAAGNGWLLRAGGPAQGKAERATDTFGDGGEGTRALQGYVLRSEHPTLPRKLQEEHAIRLSYTWVQKALQGAGLVAKRHKRGPHRRRRPRRPMVGMLLHIDGSKHQWLNDDRWYDLIVILDDANTEIYYAQLVEEESTRTVMAGLREVVEVKGVFCALYSDRGSHFFVTMKAGEKVDKERLTQVGRALKELGIQMIAAYSPQ